MTTYPFPNKTVNAFALLVAPEASYGAGAVLTGSVGSFDSTSVQMANDVTFEFDYISKGTRPEAPGSLGMLRLNVHAGRSVKGTIEVEAKGCAGPVSQSSQLEWAPLLLASGFSGSVGGSTASFHPDDVNAIPNSVAMQVFSRNELTSVSGGLATFTFKADAGKAGTFSFALQGISAILSQDVGVAPEFQYQNEFVLPPILQGLNLSIGSFTGSVVTKVEYDHGRKLTARPNANSPLAHAGFTIGHRDPSLKMTIEAPFQSSFDVHNALEESSVYAVSFAMPGSAGNNIGFSFPNAQLTDVKAGKEGPVATWDLTFSPTISPNGSNIDDVLITVY